MRIEIKDKKNFIKMFNSIHINNKISTINGVSIDSRKVMKNDIFFPIKGENYDGHKFINDSIENGAIVSFSEVNTQLRTQTELKILVRPNQLSTIVL